MLDRERHSLAQTPAPFRPSPWQSGAAMSGADCEAGFVWLIGAFIVGMSFGACLGTVVAGLCRAAAIGNRVHRGGP